MLSIDVKVNEHYKPLVLRLKKICLNLKVIVLGQQQALLHTQISAVLIGLSLSLLLIMPLTGCSKTPREQMLRETISQMQTYLENGEPSKFTHHVAKDFSFNNNYDRAWVKRILTWLKFRKAQLKIITTKVHIEMNADESEADAKINGFTAAVEKLSIQEGRQFKLVTQWYYESGRWQIYRVVWKKPPSVLLQL